MAALDELLTPVPNALDDLLKPTPERAALDKTSPSFADYARGLASGVNNIITTAGEGLNLLGAEKIGKAVREFGQSGEQYWQEAMTPAGKEAAGGDLENRPLSTIGMAAAQSLPGMAAMFVPGLGATKALQAANMARPVFGALKDVGVGAKRAAKIARAAPVAVGMGASEGVYSGLSNAAQTAQEIAQTPIDQLSQTPAYRAIEESNQNLVPEEIRNLLSVEAERQVALRTAPWTGAIGALTGGGILGQIAQKATGGVAKNIVKGAAKEAGQEIPQSGGEAYIQNVVAGETYDPSRPAMQDVAKQAIIGGGAGGLLGGLGGGVHALSKPQFTPHEELLNKTAETVITTRNAETKLTTEATNDRQNQRTAAGQKTAKAAEEADAAGQAVLTDDVGRAINGAALSSQPPVIDKPEPVIVNQPDKIEVVDAVPRYVNEWTSAHLVNSDTLEYDSRPFATEAEARADGGDVYPPLNSAQAISGAGPAVNPAVLAVNPPVIPVETPTPVQESSAFAKREQVGTSEQVSTIPGKSPAVSENGPETRQNEGNVVNLEDFKALSRSARLYDKDTREEIRVTLKDIETAQNSGRMTDVVAEHVRSASRIAQNKGDPDDVLDALEKAHAILYPSAANEALPAPATTIPAQPVAPQGEAVAQPPAPSTAAIPEAPPALPKKSGVIQDTAQKSGQSVAIRPGWKLIETDPNGRQVFAHESGIYQVVLFPGGGQELLTLRKGPKGTGSPSWETARNQPDFATSEKLFKEAERRAAYLTSGQTRSETTTTQREPWEMTRAEYFAETRAKAVKLHGEKWAASRLDRSTPSDMIGQVNRKHASAVGSALAAGKPVPAAVLADYPDLQQNIGTSQQVSAVQKPPDLPTPVGQKQETVNQVERPAGKILGKDVRKISDVNLARFAKSKTVRIADLAKAELAWRQNSVHSAAALNTAPAKPEQSASQPSKPAEAPFDSDAFDKKRADTIKASREAGNTHLDKVLPSVETMRGREIFYAHNPKQRGVIRTVDNRGNVYVHWSDEYSAGKELASEEVEDNKFWLKSSKALPYMRVVRDGKTYVMGSSLGPSDLKDYVFADSSKPAESKPAAPVAEAAKPESTEQTPEQIYDASLETFKAASRKFTAVRNDYRAKKVDDATFLAAKAAFDEAQAVADAAETRFIDSKNVPAAPTPEPPVSTPAEKPLSAADYLEAAAKLMREQEKPAQPNAEPATPEPAPRQDSGGPDVESYSRGEQETPQSLTVFELTNRGFDTSRVYYHQTAKENVEPIKANKFDLSKGRARLNDEGVPDGVFFKPTPQDIGVGARADEAAQIPVYIRFGKTLTVADRAELAEHLNPDETYWKLAAEARIYDREQSKAFDEVWKEKESGERDSEVRKEKSRRLNSFLDKWKVENEKRAAAARARATEVLKAEGIDTVVIKRDQGSGNRATETIITLSGNQVALAEQDDNRILFSQTSEPGPGLPAADIRSHLSAITAKLSVDVPVYDSVEQARLAGFKIADDAKGFAKGDRLGLISGRIKTLFDVEKTLFHELWHVGIKRVTSNPDAVKAFANYNQALNRVAISNPEVRKRAKEWRDKYGADKRKQFEAAGVTGSELELRVRTQSFDEAIASIAGERKGNISRVNDVIAALQRLVRALGFDELASWMESHTDAEVLSLIRSATQAVSKDTVAFGGELAGETMQSRLDQTQTAEFKAWSKGAPVINAEQAGTHQFKTGVPVVGEAFHGTNKFGFTEFKVPAWFGTNPDVALSYADESLANLGARSTPVGDSFNEREAAAALGQSLTAGTKYISGKSGFAEKIGAEWRVSIRGEQSVAPSRSEAVRALFNDAVRTGAQMSGIYRVYINLQNPKVYRDYAQLEREFPEATMPTEVAASRAKDAGYDGMIIRNIENAGKFDVTALGEPIGVEYVAFRQDQIKSVDNDRPTSDPDIMHARAGGLSWDAPEPSKMDNLIYSIQDKQIDTKRVLEQIRKHVAVSDTKDVRLQEELYHGRTAKLVDDFLNTEMKPLVAEMVARKVTMPEFEEYLHARHAEEANAVIAARNPNMPDGGSGIDTQDARDYLSSLDPAKKRAYEALAQRIDAMNTGSRQLLVDYGLESQDTIDTWKAAYKNYVPLHREDMGGGPGIGQGFSVRGPASKMRTGSTRKVVNIIANIAMQREKNIVRGEKKRIGKALYGLAKDNPNPEFWKLAGPGITTQINAETGDPVEIVDMSYKNRPNVVMFRDVENGKVIERGVEFNEQDERAMRMALALKNLDMDDLGHVLGMSAKITRYMASVNTQYNPVFGVVNITRDVQGAMLNLSSTELAGHQVEVLKNTLSALRGIYIDTRDTRQGKPATSAWAQLWEEFQTVGGKTGYRDMFRTSKDRAEAIEYELNPTKWMDSPLGKIFTANGALKVPLEKADKMARGVFGWLSDYNTAGENAVRLAAYKAGIDAGMTKQRAASLAKNLTVNFNRKGQIATQAGALYAFFNASVQGTARLAETLAGPTGRKIIVGGITLGAVQALMLAAAGFDDDEPPEFIRERSTIIPIGDKKYITIPMPLGLHFIPNIGRIATEFVLSGFKNPAKRVMGLANVFADAFNPVGSAGLSLQTITPTVIDPIAALAENRDWTGKPITRQDMSQLSPTPGHTRAKDTASVFSKATSKALNYMSGGTDYKPGLFSPSPDAIDYLIGQATGGVGRETMKLEQSITSAFTGEDLPSYKIPLVGRFYGDAEQQSSQGNAFYSNLKAINEHEAEVKGRRKAGEPIGDYFSENPEARLIPLANATERQVSQLRKRKRELMAKDAGPETVKAIDLQITARMKRFNERVKQVSASAP